MVDLLFFRRFFNYMLAPRWLQQEFHNEENLQLNLLSTVHLTSQLVYRVLYI